MVAFLCSIWPLLAAGLLGWLLCGLVARSFLRGPDLSGALAAKDADVRRLSNELATLRAQPPVEKLVEKIVEKPVDRVVEKVVDKIVDNPAQVAQIAALTAQVAMIAGMRSRISELESTPPKVVEKIIEKPVHKIVEKIVDRPVDRIVEKVVEKPVDRIVEKVVEKQVDNPAQLARIAALTAEVAVIAGLRSRISQLEAAPAKVVEKIVEKPVDRVVEKIVEKIVDRPVDRVVEKLVPDTRGLAERDAEIRRLKVLLEPAIDLPAARAAGFTLKGPNDLEVIEGIGPKIAELLYAKGIRTFAQLAATPTSRIQEILDEAGGNFRVSNPGTWAEQADLCARNRWSTLRSLQDVLVAGVRVDGSAAPAARPAAAAPAAAKPAEPPPPVVDLAAARAAGFAGIKGRDGQDDLEIVEGIGPKIAELLHAAGVKRFHQLARMTAAQIQPILDKAGPSFRMAKPDTWPEQSRLAANNRWAELKTLQDELNAGNRG